MSKLAHIITGLLFSCGLLIGCASEEEVDLSKARSHQIPGWFKDAKLGIFIHWGLPSVPAFAAGEPFKSGELERLMSTGKMPEEAPYSEWYQFSLANGKGATYEWHAKNYGADAPYDIFQEKFEQNVKNWNPATWADLFASYGARYVVLVTKHHDGYALWPSDVDHPHKSGWSSERDLVGELAAAVRAKGMRFGTYYSSGLDWSFHLPDESDTYARFVRSAPMGQDYADYVHAHIRELTDRYKPDIMWSDIGYPSKGRRSEVLDYYFQSVPDGVINDRWEAFDAISAIANLPGGVWLAKMLGKLAVRSAEHPEPIPETPAHFGYKTAEYSELPEIYPHPWESTRGLGGSFGFNHLETEEDMLTGGELISYFIDTVAKNGNVLINVGPDSFGQIPAIQQKPLQELGAWLETNAAAIYGTTPWNSYGETNSEGTELRFTRDDKHLYVIVLEASGNEFTLENLGFEPERGRVLGWGDVALRKRDGGWLVNIEDTIEEGFSVPVLQIPLPERLK